MKFYYCFSVLFLFFCLNSCKSNGSFSPSSSSSIQDVFPLKVGNTWIYAVTEYSESGNPKGTYFDTLHVIGSKNYNGVTAFEMMQQGTGSDTLLFYYGASDLYSVQGNQTSIGLHYPMNVGDSYVLKDTVVNGFIEKEILVFQSNSESVTVPAGTFSTLHFDQLSITGNVSAPDTSGITKQYFALGKGMVRESDYGYDQYKNRILVNSVQLQSYDLK